MKNNIKYSIVIGSYNHCDDLLKKCVEAIIAYTHLPDIELVIIANGCFDETKEYLLYLEAYFSKTNKIGGFQQVFFAEPLGYARANNIGIKLCHADKILLLNNDAFLLPQEKNTWLNLLDAPFNTNPKCGISCVLKTFSDPAGHDFAIFFCVLIKREVFDAIGLLNEEYGKGGGEDTEFSIEAEKAGYEVIQTGTQTWSEEANLHIGEFPIYHRGEGTVHDKVLVPDWDDVFVRNSLKLAKKYNPRWYQWKISNNCERAVFLKGDPVSAREVLRYKWAADNIVGKKVLEIGCSSGYGLQFLPKGLDYIGLDYDAKIVEVAAEQEWYEGAKFIHADANKFEFDQYDTILAFESIEHIPGGLELLERLKNHSPRILITVPYNENPSQYSPHHLLHNLTIDSFSEFHQMGLMDRDGRIITGQPDEQEYELIAYWTRNNPAPKSAKLALNFLNATSPNMYREVIQTDCYNVIKDKDRMVNREVIDVGANVGAFSLLAGYLGAKKIIAVEPIGTTYAQLNNNIKIAGLTQIQTFNNLVSDVAGKQCNISLNTNSGHNSQFNVRDDYETVESITLTDLLGKLDGNDIFLKLDCEGAEYDILLNASSEEMNRITDIAIEIHMDLHPIHKGWQIIETFLLSHGFTKTKDDQIYAWDFDSHGTRINMREIPFRNQHWIK